MTQRDETCWNARSALLDAKRDMLNGDSTIEAVYAAAAAYRDALKAWKKRTGNTRFRVPSVSQLIRQVT
jgi:hypothetical protein